MLETSRCIAIKQGSIEAIIHELSNTPYSIGKDQKHCYQIERLRYQCLALDEESKSLTNEQGIPTYFATIHKNQASIFVNVDVLHIRDVKYPDAEDTLLTDVSVTVPQPEGSLPYETSPMLMIVAPPSMGWQGRSFSNNVLIAEPYLPPNHIHLLD